MSPDLSISYWHWWIFCGVLLVVELVLPGTFFLWLGIAAAMVGLIVLFLPSLSLDWQGLLFAVLSIINVISWRLYLRKYPPQTDQPLLNRRGQQYIGRVFTLSEAIVNGYGRAKVGDGIWKVSGPDCPVGTQVRVIDIDENLCLRIEPLSSHQ